MKVVAHSIEEYKLKQVILEHVTESDIAQYYLGITKTKELVPHPFRKDVKPSFAVGVWQGIVMCRDFSNNKSYTIWEVIRLMYNLNSLTDVYNKVFKDLVEKKIQSKPLINVYGNKIQSTLKDSKISKLQVTIRDWTEEDSKYWMSYGVPVEWLTYAEVYPISHIFITYSNNEVNCIPTANKAYAFVERKEGIISYKIYQPENKDFKWLNTHNGSVISLWTKIPEKGDKLIICSSVKDALCVWANTNIPCIALQGEGYGISDTAKNNLINRFNKIYILFDNDNPGLLDGEKLSKSTGFINIILPQFQGGKDISDYYKQNDKYKTQQLIKSLIK